MRLPRSSSKGLPLAEMALWLLVTVGFAIDWGRAALLLGALVLVPLALRAAAAGDSSEADLRDSRYWRWLGVLRLPAALALVVAHLLAPGTAAAVLAGPWALVCLLLTRLGFWRLRRRRFRGPGAEWALDGALLLQIVGGGWIVVERAGLRPYGFDAGLVLLSAIHTHLAALVLPVLLGLAARDLRGWPVSIVVGASLAAFPLVAAGILAAPLLEWWGGWLLAACGVTTALLQLRRAAQTSLGSGTRLLLAGSSAALLVAMWLAFRFAGAPSLGWPLLDRATMLAWHGGLAAAFATLGLAAWAIAPALPPARPAG